MTDSMREPDEEMRKIYEQGGEPVPGAVYVSLREQVARRLHDLYMADAAAEFVKWDKSPPSEREVWIERVAPEVIRCMEWARREVEADWLDNEGGPYVYAPGTRPDLTLPPEDWHP